MSFKNVEIKFFDLWFIKGNNLNCFIGNYFDWNSNFNYEVFLYV